MSPGYVARRCGTFLLVVWIALTVNFVLPRIATPEVSRARGETARQFLLDRPLWDQYGAYLVSLAHFDLNYSVASYPNRVADQIGYALPWTMALLGTTSLLAGRSAPSSAPYWRGRRDRSWLGTYSRRSCC